MSRCTDQEIKCWLKSVLKNENLLDFTISRAENPQKSDGYLGDIVLINAVAETRAHSSKTYHLVLKCSKNSETSRESLPVKDAFENEIHFYENIIPAFTDFQKERGSTRIFDSTPKCYGSYREKNREVLVLENLKMKGYYLCNSKEPLQTDHLKLILQNYAKLHAISAAMQDQEPEKFRKLVEGMKSMWKFFAEKTDLEAYFGAPIDELFELLKSDLRESTALKLKNFKSQAAYIFREGMDNSHFSVINHGDSWNNNFMFKWENENELKVAMLDFQTLKFTNPAMDVSYCIFACASKEDLDHFHDLQKFYYDSFSENVRLLKSDTDKIYSFSQFLEDFKIFGKYGVLWTLLAVKVALCDQEEAPDFTETSNSDSQKSLFLKNQNQALLKSRMLYIVEKVAEQNIF